MMISDIYCGQPSNLGLLGSMSVVSRESTVRHPVIAKSRPMSEFGRVTVTTKLGQLSWIVTDFQSEQLGYDRSGDRTCDLKHRSTLTIPLSHLLKYAIKVSIIFQQKRNITIIGEIKNEQYKLTVIIENLFAIINNVSIQKISSRE